MEPEVTQNKLHKSICTAPFLAKFNFTASIWERHACCIPIFLILLFKVLQNTLRALNHARKMTCCCGEPA